MELWPLWIVFVLLIAMIIHYMLTPTKFVSGKYDISPTILATYGPQLEKAKSEALSESEYLKSIREVMIESKKISKAKPVVIADVETPEIDSPYQQILDDPTTPEKTDSSDVQIDINSLIPEGDLDEIYSESQEVSENILLLDVHRIKMGKVLDSKQGRKILDLINVYEDSIPEDVQLTLLNAIYEYSLEPKVSSIGGQDIREEEENEYKNIFDILRDVTLFDHVLHVTEEISRELGLSPGFEDSLAGNYFLLALYHDIAKMSHIRERKELSSYRRLDHPVISAQYLREILPSVDENVVLAIQMHHDKHYFNSGDGFFKALKSADHRARENEAKAQLGEVPTLLERMSRDETVSLILDIFETESEKVTTQTIPNAAFIKGHIIIRKDVYFEAVKSKISRTTGTCREMLDASELKFTTAALKLLSEHRLVPEILLSKKIQLTTTAFGKTRAQFLDKHIAVPVTTLGLIESEIPVSNFSKSVSTIDFI